MAANRATYHKYWIFLKKVILSAKYRELIVWTVLKGPLLIKIGIFRKSQAFSVIVLFLAKFRIFIKFKGGSKTGEWVILREET